MVNEKYVKGSYVLFVALETWKLLDAKRRQNGLTPAEAYLHIESQAKMLETMCEVAYLNYKYLKERL